MNRNRRGVLQGSQTMTYSPDRLEQLDAPFRAANYLGAGGGE
jgi:hypothetical protein